jgi:hypothetical protein
LVSRAKVICQDQKDFNKETKNIRQDLILNEYQQEFVDSIMKPGRNNRPSSDTSTIYHGTILIPYVRVFPKNSDALGTDSMLEIFSKLNMHSVGH